MKKVMIISVIGVTLLLLYLFSFSPSEEEKITWGGKYPPPPKELTWKEKWERSKLSYMEQDELNGGEFLSYYGSLVSKYDSLYYTMMREPVILLDKSAYHKILRFQRYKSEEYDVEYPPNRVLCNGLDTNGETFELLSKKYLKDKLISHNVDTFRYGCPIHDHIRNPELSYMLSRIHYAEVHVYRWYVRGNPQLIKTIYFINDNGVLRSFWGFQLGEGYYLPDYVFY